MTVTESTVGLIKSYYKMGIRCTVVPSRSKQPAYKGWQKPLTYGELISAIGNSTDTNISALWGEPSGGACDVDVDSRVALAITHRFLPDCGFVYGRDGKPQSHYVYKVTGDLHNIGVTDPITGTMIIELRGNGLHSIIPPSTHPNGERFKINKLEYLTKINGNVLLSLVKRIGLVATLITYWPNVGGRQTATMHVVGMLARYLPANMTREIISVICEATGDEEASKRLDIIDQTYRKISDNEDVTGLPSVAQFFGISEEWLRSCFDESSEAEPEREKHKVAESHIDREIPYNDTGNARRMISRFGDDLKYVSARDAWMLWVGSHWMPMDGVLMQGYARQVSQELIDSADLATDSREADFLRKFGTKSGNTERIAAMIQQAKDSVAISINEYDKDPYMFNCLNGTVDLRTGELHGHKRDDMLSQIAPVKYNPDAVGPHWDQFLDDITLGNRESRRFLQRMIGYSIVGITQERLFFILHGKGKNGKTVFLDQIAEVVGDYYLKMPVESLLHKKYGSSGASNDIAMLKGKRIVVTSEPDQGRRLGEGLLKELTGSEKSVRARFLFKEYFEFRVQATIIMATNHIPYIYGTDEGIWDRIAIVPFNARFTGDKSKTRQQLDGEFKQEYEAILAWVIQGAIDYNREGLGRASEVVERRTEYRRDMDTVQQWIEDCCVIHADARNLHVSLYESYKDWCKTYSTYAHDGRGFSMELEQRGFTKVRTTNGMEVRGIAVKVGN